MANSIDDVVGMKKIKTPVVAVTHASSLSNDLANALEEASPAAWIVSHIVNGTSDIVSPSNHSPQHCQLHGTNTPPV